jgi:hypothetical protein
MLTTERKRIHFYALDSLKNYFRHNVCDERHWIEPDFKFNRDEIKTTIQTRTKRKTRQTDTEKEARTRTVMLKDMRRICQLMNSNYSKLSRYKFFGKKNSASKIICACYFDLLMCDIRTFPARRKCPNDWWWVFLSTRPMKW